MKKSSDVFSEIIVGIFMVAVLALLAYFTIVISGVDMLMGPKRVSARIAFSDVGGLKERDSVVYRGMKVGTVDNISLDGDVVTVHVKISRDVVLRTRSRITVSSNSILGGNFLQMNEGTGDALPLETTLFHGERPLDWMRDLGEIARDLNSISSDGGFRAIITNLEAASENVNLIIARVQRGEGTLGKLLGPEETVYADLKSTMADAKATMASAKNSFSNISEIAEHIRSGQGLVGKLLAKDDAAYGNLTNTLAHVSEIVDRVAAGEGMAGRLLSKDETMYADLRQAVANIRAASQKFSEGNGLFARLANDNEIAENAATLVKNLRDVSTRLAEGKGTLGRLTNDAEMYNELNVLIKDLRQIVDNYRDTTPISSFAGLVGGAL